MFIISYSHNKNKHFKIVCENLQNYIIKNLMRKSFSFIIVMHPTVYNAVLSFYNCDSADIVTELSTSYEEFFKLIHGFINLIKQ